MQIPYVGLSTDFFVQEADAWRNEAWRIIKCRPDMVFRLLTKKAKAFLYRTLPNMRQQDVLQWLQ